MGCLRVLLSTRYSAVPYSERVLDASPHDEPLSKHPRLTRDSLVK